MSKPLSPDALLLETLREQIREICVHFQQIREEAADIVHRSKMPDATLHLNDVLQHTEKATTAILDAATQISGIAEASTAGADDKQKLAQLIGTIYESCSFQDITGQQIRKVLEHMNSMETQLMRLSDTASGHAPPEKSGDPLLNGPQLSTEAPSQSDIDKLFAAKN